MAILDAKPLEAATGVSVEIFWFQPENPFRS